MDNKKCWICGNDADSREHGIKKSNFKTLFGSVGSYVGEDELCLVTEQGQKIIQSADSKYLKFDVLCQTCNTTKTQPFDKAYEKFIIYINTNEKDILHKRFIDFSIVYGKNWEEEQVNLYKYLVKSFGCRLARFNHPIPQDMIDLLDKKIFQTALRITFAVNEDMVTIGQIDKSIRGLGNGDIGVNQSYIDGTNRVLFYTYSEVYDWLHIYYWYDYQPDGNLGSTWIADNQFIYFGSFFSSLNDKQREEFILKAKTKKGNIK